MCGFVGFTAVDYDTDTNKAVVKDLSLIHIYEPTRLS